MLEGALNSIINILFGSLLLVSISAASVETGSPVCANEKCLEYEMGLEATRKAVVSIQPIANQSSLGCPTGGHTLNLGSTKRNGTLPNAEGVLKALRAQNQIDSRVLETDGSKCGPCLQVNLVSPFTVTRPAKTKLNPLCNNRPTKTISGRFSTEKEAKSFAERVLKGKNAQGKELYVGCPDPCSFRVFNSETLVEGGGFVATLVVQCGQPRSSGPLFAPYEFSHGNIHQWACYAR